MTDWFKPRHYKHFDHAVNEAYAKNAENPAFVSQHSFSPMIHYEKQIKRYKKKDGKTVTKDRPIKYASHRDACVLSYYSSILNSRLDAFYASNGLNANVIAYRSLGLANYDFAAEAHHYVEQNAPVSILAFDVSGFFDNLDHFQLKSRLKRILGVTSLDLDWLKVLRFITRFHFVNLEDLRASPIFSVRLKEKGIEPIATVAELKAQGVLFRPNPKVNAGIPQGTPISATMSNLYMIDFDMAAVAMCDKLGALYRRYSDDILIVCKPDDASNVEAFIEKLMGEQKLELSPDKTERTYFDPADSSLSGQRSAQYLGFSFYPDGAGIRPSSLSRQWRKMRRAIKRTRYAAEEAISGGKTKRVYTKRLRNRFSKIFDSKQRQPVRNFFSYASRSALAFGTEEKISQQVKRLEREFLREVHELKKLNRP